jgi:hypothetical protein
VFWNNTTLEFSLLHLLPLIALYFSKSSGLGSGEAGRDGVRFPAAGHMWHGDECTNLDGSGNECRGIHATKFHFQVAYS